MTRGRWTGPGLMLVLALGTNACGGGGAPASPTPPTDTMSPQARAYLEQMLGLMQANSINRLKIDWANLRATVFAQAPTAQVIASTYPAIRMAITLLGDGHSSFSDPSGFIITPPGRSCGATTVVAPTLPATIGYVRVPGFSGIGAGATAFANGLQRTIMAGDRDGVIGWIVDVRGNRGGNMWPMVAGVGPLLGEGVIGYFIDPAGGESVWEYRDGASWDHGVVQQQVDAPYRLRRERPRVAVLTDGGTISSGEATVIAFRGRPDSRSFGAPTCGLSTAIENYPMSDGASLNLAISVMADRTRSQYGFAVEPDELVESGRVVERAIAWLRTGS